MLTARNYWKNMFGCRPRQVQKTGAWYAKNPGVIAAAWDEDGITAPWRLAVDICFLRCITSQSTRSPRTSRPTSPGPRPGASSWPLGLNGKPS